MGETNVTKKLDKIFRRLQNTEDTNNLYTKWSETYDEEMEQPDAYKGFLMVSKLLDLFSFRNKDITILDVGAGTGLIGVELRKMGYNNINALEPNEAMRKIALGKNIYNKIISEPVRPDEPIKSIDMNSYDRVTVAGCFAPGHMDYRHIKNLVRILKPGGMLIFGFRHSYVETHQKDVIPEIKRLEEEKIIKLTLNNEVPDYYPGVSCFMVVLTKL